MIDEAVRCAELVEAVTDWLENALPEERQAEVEEHLAICPWCVEYANQMRVTTRLLGRLGDDEAPPAPPESHERLLRAFRSWRTGEAGPSR